MELELLDTILTLLRLMRRRVRTRTRKPHFLMHYVKILSPITNPWPIQAHRLRKRAVSLALHHVVMVASVMTAPEQTMQMLKITDTNSMQEVEPCPSILHFGSQIDPMAFLLPPLLSKVHTPR
jgi:hypothetical protein